MRYLSPCVADKDQCCPCETLGVPVQTDAKTGQIKVEADVEGNNYKVRNTVYDASGKEVGLKVKNPHLWSVEDPYIYKVRTQVMIGGKVVDEVWTTTGFRDFKFDAETGFWLNGKNFKLNGVCEHHDFGCLGAAVNEDAMHRKLEVEGDGCQQHPFLA